MSLVASSGREVEKHDGDPPRTNTADGFGMFQRRTSGQYSDGRSGRVAYN